MKKNILGYTLVELILVIVVLGVLTAVGTVIWSGVTGSSANNVRSTEVKQWASTFDLYKSRFGSWPVLPTDDSTPAVVCLGDFTATGGKCGNLTLASQTYTADSNLLAAVKTVGKEPENTAPQASTKVAGPIAYLTQTTSGGVSTVTAKYINFFQGNTCPTDFTNVSNQEPARSMLRNVTSTIACAPSNNESFAYNAGNPPSTVPVSSSTPTPVPSAPSAPSSSTPTPVPSAPSAPSSSTPTPRPTPVPTPRPTPTPIPAPIPAPSTTNRTCVNRSNIVMQVATSVFCAGLALTAISTAVTGISGSIAAVGATVIGGPIAGAVVIGVTQVAMVATVVTGVALSAAAGVVAGVATAVVVGTVNVVKSIFSGIASLFGG